jgi:hypothetical protein
LPGFRAKRKLKNRFADYSLVQVEDGAEPRRLKDPQSLKPPKNVGLTYPAGKTNLLYPSTPNTSLVQEP